MGRFQRRLACDPGNRPAELEGSRRPLERGEVLPRAFYRFDHCAIACSLAARASAFVMGLMVPFRTSRWRRACRLRTLGLKPNGYGRQGLPLVLNVEPVPRSFCMGLCDSVSFWSASRDSIFLLFRPWVVTFSNHSIYWGFCDLVRFFLTTTREKPDKNVVDIMCRLVHYVHTPDGPVQRRIKTMTDTFTFHTDPGHGWVQVEWTDLKALGLNPTDFSRYSYRKGNTFYLEEDCDASKFVAAYEAKHGARPNFRDNYADRTPIRGYARIW